MAQHLSYLIFCLMAGMVRVAYCDSVLHDPTQPPAMFNTPQAGTTQVNESPVQLIMIRNKQYSALIRNKMVKTGDRIQEGRIVRITDHDLWVRTDGQMNTIKLYPAVSKRLLAIPAPSFHRNPDK